MYYKHVYSHRIYNYHHTKVFDDRKEKKKKIIYSNTIYTNHLKKVLPVIELKLRYIENFVYTCKYLKNTHINFQKVERLEIKILMFSFFAD